MKTIQASDISSFIYCQRAWWYQKNGYISNTYTELSTGSRHHLKHGRMVTMASIIRLIAIIMILIALALIFIYFS